MTADTANASRAQFELPPSWSSGASELRGSLLNYLAGWSTWQYVVTIFLGLVVYDQGMMVCDGAGGIG